MTKCVAKSRVDGNRIDRNGQPAYNQPEGFRCSVRPAELRCVEADELIKCFPTGLCGEES